MPSKTRKTWLKLVNDHSSISLLNFQVESNVSVKVVIISACEAECESEQRPFRTTNSEEILLKTRMTRMTRMTHNLCYNFLLYLCYNSVEEEKPLKIIEPLVLYQSDINIFVMISFIQDIHIHIHIYMYA